MNFYCLKYFFILIILYSNTVEQSRVTIETSYGKLVGQWNATDTGKKYATFQGVPYAEPPVGENRFMEPQSLQPWSGYLNATEYSPVCFQFDLFSNQVSSSEDCLYLNIFSSNPLWNASLPVIVFIHGGGLNSGSASQYDPVRIMEYDIVVITINYRLGPLGTFHRGVQYSGFAFAPWALDEKPVQKTKYLAGRVGCPNDTSIEMITCLRNASAEDMVTSQLGLLVSQVRLSSIFGPVIESPDVVNPFLIQNPFKVAESGLMQKLPLMMTTTFAEGLSQSGAYLARQEYLDDLESRWDQLASEVFAYKDSLPEYLHEETAKAFSDRLYLNDVGKQAELHALFSGKPVYTGLYSYRGSYSFSDYLSNSTNNYGAAHLDDILHIFKAFNLDSNSTGDLAMNKVLTAILVSFALNGVPQLPDGTEYPSLTPGSSVINRLEIISPTQFALTSSSLSNFGNRTFWNSFGFYENENA